MTFSVSFVAADGLEKEVREKEEKMGKLKQVAIKAKKELESTRKKVSTAGPPTKVIMKLHKVKNIPVLLIFSHAVFLNFNKSYFLYPTLLYSTDLYIYRFIVFAVVPLYDDNSKVCCDICIPMIM